MSRLPALAALLAFAAGPAAAGEARCWFENGVVVVAAEVAGVPGDYILDTATPRTTLAETQAQTAGYEATELEGDIRLAGVRLARRPIAVADLDLRTGALPTPVAGVIGADVLSRLVLDVRFSPCRVTLSRRAATPFHAEAALQIAWVAGRPTVRAAVSDGPHALAGAFAVGVGADTGVRISDALATAPGAAKPKELYPYGVLFPRLRAFSFAGRLFEDQRAGLIAAEDPALAGQIGAPLLARWRLRFDFPRGRLLLAPAYPTQLSSRFSRQRKTGTHSP